MTDRPITFSAPMIHALWDGRKTQTRRVLKPQPVADAWGGDPAGAYPVESGWRALPYAPGDRLWVKEAWRTEARYDALPPSQLPDDALIHYEAYGQPPPWAGRYRNARFMLRRLSRLTLIVTDVRVQRVQDISEADARAEGVEPDQCRARGKVIGWRDYLERGGKCGTARGSFQSLWNSIHGPDAWDRNDWIAALTFGVHRKNIGEMAND